MSNSARILSAETLLDQRQAASFLSIEPRTLEAWRQRRIGPRWLSYSRRCVRYRLSDLQSWLSEREVGAENAA